MRGWLCNARWLALQCKMVWQEMKHPEWPELPVAELLQDETFMKQLIEAETAQRTVRSMAYHWR
mgnify:FL=1